MTLKKVTIILIPFLLAAVIIGYTPKSTETSAYNVKKANFNIDEYLEKNHTEIDLDSGNGYGLLDRDINKSQVIITGKCSTIGQNYQVKLSLLKYLNKRNVRYLLEDMGYSESSLINEYLKSGNESYLKQVYENKSGPIICTGLENDYINKRFYDFLIELRKYNLSLPESKRIMVIGIGTENQVGMAIKYLNSLLPESKPYEEIKPFIKDLKNIGKQKSIDGIINDIEKLQNSMEASPDIYKKYLGSRYFDFHFIIDNIINADKVYTAVGADMKKEQELCLFSNFKAMYSDYPGGNYFGEFNMEHFYNKDVNSFATYLNSSNSPVQGRVLTIDYASENSDIAGKNLNILKGISKSDITLFNLNGDDSPFSTETYFFTGTQNRPDTDYFKYLLLIKNSKTTAADEN